MINVSDVLIVILGKAEPDFMSVLRDLETPENPSQFRGTIQPPEWLSYRNGNFPGDWG